MTLSRYNILLAAAIVLAVAAGPAMADELYFSPADTSIFDFNTFPVHVMVDDIDSIMGYNISVSIIGDPCVKIMGIVEGTLPGSNGDTTFFRWLNPSSTDLISVNGSVLGTTVDGPGILFTIFLQAMQPGTAWLDFTYSDLRNGRNVSLAHESDKRARIIVDQAIAVDGSSWGAIKNMHR